MYNNCMSDYIARPLAESILHARRKAVILEGARAVGKTMMAQRQLVGVGFSYETLADANAYELAKTDLHGWLRCPPAIRSSSSPAARSSTEVDWTARILWPVERSVSP